MWPGCGIRRTSSRKHSVRREIGRRVRISACGLLLFSQGEREGGVFRAEVDAMARCLFRLLPCHDQQQFLAFPLYADSVDFGHVCQVRRAVRMSNMGESLMRLKAPCGGWLLGGWINSARSLLWPPSCARRCRVVRGRRSNRRRRAIRPAKGKSRFPGFPLVPVPTF